MRAFKLILSTTSILFFANVFAHELGEYYQGGIIFWNIKNNEIERGLIASSSDQAKNIKWANRQFTTKATEDGVFVGKNNTKKIIDALGPAGNYAAKIAFSYREGAYNEWYLPSKYELNLMFNQRYLIGEFSTHPYSESNACTSYWSSTETSPGKAWSQSFNTGKSSDEEACGLDKEQAHVRAIRAYQEIFTTFECSAVSGIKNNANSSCGKWLNYTQGSDEKDAGGCSLISIPRANMIYECTVRNGSILVSSSQLFLDPKTNKPFKDVLLKNETKYFYGKPTTVSSLVGISAKFVVPKI